MRQVGVCDNQQQATLFTDYLLTQGIVAVAEEEGDSKWSVWVRDEDHLQLARDEFDEFQEDPADARYRQSKNEAESIRREAVRRHEERKKNTIQMRDNWRRASGRRAPLTFTIIIICVVVAIFTDFGQSYSSLKSMLMFNEAAGWEPESGLPPPRLGKGRLAFTDIEHGQVWRLVTPIFLHFGVLHLLGNMYWTYVFGTRIENRYKAWWLLWLVILIAVISNSAQAWYDGPRFGGISGVGFGLFGYIWMKSLFDPQSQLRLDQITILLFIGWFFYCLFALDNVANMAHGVGFAVGAAAGFLPSMFPQRKE